MTDVKIQEAGAFEAPVIAELHKQSFLGGEAGEIWSEAAIAKILALPGAYGILAWARDAGDGPPQGFALWRNAADEAEILSLGVAPAARRGGIGRALLRAIMARGSIGGVRRLYLEVAEDNLAAQGLYLAAGFSKVGRRRAYYRRPTGPVSALVLAWEAV
jgi:[ribosomal protein S18]-alanine N-acetyltransferase